MIVKPLSVIRSDWEDCFMKYYIYFCFIRWVNTCSTGPRQIMIVATHVGFDWWKGLFDWVEVRRIGWKEFELHSTTYSVRCLIWNIIIISTNRASIISLILIDLWMRQLSITMTEFGAGKGCIWSSSPLMKSSKRAVLNDPSTMFAYNMPLRDKAGRTEYLFLCQQALTHLQGHTFFHE